MTNEELKAATERIARVKAGERQRVVYGFEDEEMDDCMYRLLENRYVADLRTLADSYLARLAADVQVDLIATIERDRDEARAAYHELRCAVESDLGSIRDDGGGDVSFYLGSTLRAFHDRPEWRKGGTS